MPPKAKEVVVPPSEDDKPYGVLITIDVSGTDIELEAPDGTTPPNPLPAKLQLSLSLPALPADNSPAVLSAAIDVAGLRSTTDTGVKKQFRREAGMATLHMLLNAPARVNLVDAATGTPLATAELDLLNLGWGQHAWELSNIAFTILGSLPETVPPLPKVKSVTLSAAKISVMERLVDPNAPPVEVTAPTPTTPGTAAKREAMIEPPKLPDAHIYVFITPELAAGANIAELSVTGAQPPPPGLVSATTVAGGRLFVSAGLAIPSGPNVVLTGSSVKDGVISWSARQRQWVPAAAVRALKWHLEDSLPLVLELGRYLGVDGFNDPVWEHYHGAAEVQVASQLLVAGATRSSAEVTVSAYSAVAAASPNGLKTCLPTYIAPTGKSKPVEEAATVPVDSPGAWQASATALSVSFGVLVPLMPPWSPPAKPARSLAEMVPMRDFTPKVIPSTASDDFRAQVHQVAIALAAEYMRVFPEDPSPLDEPPTPSTSAAALLPGPSSAEVIEPAQRHKLLIFELNRSGKYLQLKDSLKAAVVRLVKDKYHKSSSMSPNELGTLYNELYVDLMDQLHIALAQSSGTARVEAVAAAPAVPDAAKLAVLLHLAQELEVAGELARAEVLHQQRLLADTLAEVWFEYGTFCLRIGQHGRAQECLKSALALEVSHVGALAALACLCLHQGMVTDSLSYLLAEAVCERAREVAPDSPLVWALSAMVFTVQGESRAVALVSAVQELERLERDALELKQSPAHANGFIEVAGLLLELCLPQVAVSALELVGSLRHSATRLSHKMLLYRTKAHSLVGNTDLVAESLQQLRRSAAPDDHEPHLIAGDALWRTGQWEAAVLEYQAALKAAPAACPLALHLHLGECYLALGQPEYAANVYALAVELRPCSTVWLGVGRSQLLLGDLPAAELALQEANVMDGGNSAVWAWLALAGLRAGRLEEAASALRSALQAGLHDASLLLAIAAEYVRLGHLRSAQSALQAALGVADGFEVRMQLAQVLAAQQDGEGARAHLLAAQPLAASEEEANVVEQLLAEL